MKLFIQSSPASEFYDEQTFISEIFVVVFCFFCFFLFIFSSFIPLTMLVCHRAEISRKFKSHKGIHVFVVVWCSFFFFFFLLDCDEMIGRPSMNFL